MEPRGRAKRTFDVAVTVLAAPAALLVVGLASVVLLIIDGRPVLFRQRRVGRCGEPFTIIKLRTMVTNADRLLDEAGQPLADRMTRTGPFLRATGLDEAPQLVNVLRGEMSLVGPRPMLDDRRTRRLVAAGHPRFSVRPGLTGLAQVEGRNTAPWSVRLAFDADYAERPTLRRDLVILLRTTVAIARRTGFSRDQAPGQVDDISADGATQAADDD